VRTAAVGAPDEAAFLARTRRAGLLVRTRWATGSRTEVVGYAVAERPPRGEKPVFYGGGKLARDLSLPALRAHWPTPDAEASAAALRGWRPRNWRQHEDTRGRGEPRLRIEAWRRAAEIVTDTQTRLSAVDPHDHTAWAAAAREAAGALAGVAERVEPSRRAQLARAADTLAWAGQPGRDGREQSRDETGQLAAVAQVATDTWIAGRNGVIGMVGLIGQLSGLSQQIAAANHAAGRAHDAALAAAAHAEMLDYTRHAAGRPELAQPARAQQASAQRAPAAARRPPPTQRRDHGRGR
jgi:hypothetical protein